jgi:hypothetical protein
MPNHRTPLDKANMTGQANKNPQRYRTRKEPTVSKPIGAAPRWMNTPQRKVWALFVAEIPWLNVSHRSILEIASTARARMHADKDGNVANMTLLRQCLGALGATPATASNVAMPDHDKEDPAEKYFR